MKRRFSRLSKNIKILMMAVVATAILAGGSVYVWQQVSATRAIIDLQQQLNNLQNQIRQLQQDTSKSNSFKNWKTYRNEKYGFEIDYPTDGWEFYSREEKNPVFLIARDGYRDTGREFYYITGHIEFVDPQCYGNSWGREIYPKIFQCIVDYRFNLEIEKEIVTDYKMRGFQGRGGGVTYGRIEGAVFPLLKDAENFFSYPILLISYNLDEHYTQEDLKIFDRVVSSFRFLDSEDEMTQLLNEDYLNALRTADLFLTATIKRDAESGYNLLSERLKNEAFKKGYSKDDLLIALSGLSNPHHHAFEIFNGLALEENIYEFQVFFYDYYTGQEVEFNKGKPELLKLVKRQEGEYTKWYVDSLPQDIRIYLQSSE